LLSAPKDGCLVLVATLPPTSIGSGAGVLAIGSGAGVLAIGSGAGMLAIGIGSPSCLIVLRHRHSTSQT